VRTKEKRVTTERNQSAFKSLLKWTVNCSMCLKASHTPHPKQIKNIWYLCNQSPASSTKHLSL